ncbi:hypothetical protein FIBSPDRAFT_890694 [Athelia psychrophila]|uniref:Uncharacterized protein n=1 Tax=Athelia psychrophila TaxID=1759441 RepID=A0A166KPE7_9AGAM|nr:hypothetical protein FIBSPDRAFT_890694 [Fibularhizoctonia sp. CBS 109695]
MSESSTLTCCKCGSDLTRPDIKNEEFPDLLDIDSNHVLPAAQSDIVHNAISKAFRDVSQIDQEILRFEAILAKLRLKRAERQDNAVTLKAFVSPIRRVPPEIITEIFLICTSGCPTSPPRLAAICSRWRSIALSSPHLWSSLSLVLQSERLPSQTAFADMWLSHTAQLPLSIDLRGKEENDDIKSVIEVVVARCEQWQTVHLSLPTKLLNFLLGAAGRLHNLKELTFDDMSWQTADTSIIFATALKLNSLKIYGLDLDDPIPQLPWKQLETLEIYGNLSTRACLDMLKLTPNLLDCRILGRFLPGTTTHSIVTLPVLQLMALVLDQHSYATQFLSAMCLPALQDLYLYSLPGLTDMVAGALISLVSGGHLVGLTLGLEAPATETTRANVIAILRAIPTLQELSLTQDSAKILSPAFRDNFNAPDAHLVPDLQKLVINCQAHYVINTVVILEMVEGRLPPNNHLKRVVLRNLIPSMANPIKNRLRQIRDSGIDVQVSLMGDTPIDLDSL